MAGKKKPQHLQTPGQPPARSSASRPAALQTGGGFELPFSLPDKDDAPTINLPRLEKKLPWLMPLIYSLAIISFIPLTAIYYNRAATHKTNRWSLIPDMDNQPKWRSQQANMLFADHRASRAWPDGTVRADTPLPDPWYDEGIVNGQWATGLPPQVTVDAALLERGHQRFNIYCAMCHGEAGYGDGTVAKRADLLKEGTWTSPLTYHGDQVRNRPAGHIFNTITNGIRTMPAYGSQIPVHDRWAIVAWIRVLQASQDADIGSVPAEERSQLEAQKPAGTPAAAPATPGSVASGLNSPEPPVADRPGNSAQEAPAQPQVEAQPDAAGAGGTEEGAH
jgi:mono/diheme cytochrome c family protein